MISKKLHVLFFNFVGNLSGMRAHHQHISESEELRIEGYIGPLVIDEEEFFRIASSQVYDRMTVYDQFLPSNNNITYESHLFLPPA